MSPFIISLTPVVHNHKKERPSIMATAIAIPKNDSSTSIPPYIPTPRPQLMLSVEGEWSESALKVLKERYLKTKANGEQETPEDMCWRVADNVAHAELHWSDNWGDSRTKNYWTHRFYEMMARKDFLPNSPTLMNAGTQNGLQWAACFVQDIEDSIEGIYDTLKNSALIAKSGGGIGHCFSTLRPNGSHVGSTNGVASGPVSFLKLYNASTEQIKQGGTRRGANMATFHDWHPNLLDFIQSKMPDETGRRDITNFNISILASDAFMKAVKEDGEWSLTNPWKENHVVASYKARDIFLKICQCAWETGDPGVLFIDKANNSLSNPIPSVETLRTTNPCGEVYLGNNDSCNLGSVNISNFVETVDGAPEINFAKLERTIRCAVRFLDNVIEENPYALPEIKKKVQSIRRIGLGYMGVADALFKLRIPYNSLDGTNTIELIYKFLNEVATRESYELADKRGPFPLFFQSLWNDPTSKYYQSKFIRNGHVTIQAPTGTISIIAGCSSGIEPIFSLAYQHKVKQPDGTTRVLNIVNPVFEEIAKEEGFYSEALIDWIAMGNALDSFEQYRFNTPIPSVPQWAWNVFVNAHEVTPEQHVYAQAAAQKHVQNSVSKTVNLPHDATVQDIANVYLLAYDTGCKGVTVFRDGCLSTGQVLNVGTPKSKPSETLQGPLVPSAYMGSTTTPTPVLMASTPLVVNQEGVYNLTQGVSSKGYSLCPSCATMNLINESGCQRCVNPDCAYSACAVA